MQPSRRHIARLGPRTILALDLGTTTGCALRTADGAIASGTVSFRPSRYDGGGIRYLRFRAWLDSMAQRRCRHRRRPFRGSPPPRRHRRRARLWRPARHADRLVRAARRSPTRASPSARSSGSSPARATPTRRRSSLRSARAGSHPPTTTRPTRSPSCCGRSRPQGGVR